MYCGGRTCVYLGSKIELLFLGHSDTIESQQLTLLSQQLCVIALFLALSKGDDRLMNTF